jgi:hypothetical protein
MHAAVSTIMMSPAFQCDARPSWNVVAAPLDDEEHGAVQMAVLLAEAPGP